MRHPAPFEIPRNELPAIELESEVDTDGSDRRSVPEAEARRRALVHEIDVRGARDHVAGIDEADDAHAAEHGDAKLGVQHDHTVASLRETARADRPLVTEAVEGESSHGRVATGKEPLARGKLLDDIDQGLAVGPEHRRPARAH